MMKSFWSEMKEGTFAFSVKIAHSPGASFFIVCIMILLLQIDSASAYNGEKYREVCSKTLEMVHGGFGALLMASAGVGAVVASAAGGFRIAWALVVVALGAFTLKEYQELWFEPC
jgi:hypothetical protein